MLRKLAALAVCALAVLAFPANAAKPDASPTVTIMTQNMDDGTDLTYIIGALSGMGSVPDAVDLTFSEIVASDVNDRVKALAKEIAQHQPGFIALQEAALWQAVTDPGGGWVVVADNLGALVNALAGAYEVVAVHRLTDLALPGGAVSALRFTDRNAILVRSDLASSLSNIQSRTFDAEFPFAGMMIPAGWISVDVNVGHKKFRLVTTHLQTPIQGIKEAAKVQLAQAKELIQALRDAKIPVVICGDFNSDANHGGFVDDTKTVDHFPRAGYTEAWTATHDIGDPGLTWPFYLEDQFPPADFFAPSAALERIDLFFAKDMDPLSVNLVVVPFGYPPNASDHAGVIATFKP